MTKLFGCASMARNGSESALQPKMDLIVAVVVLPTPLKELQNWFFCLFMPFNPVNVVPIPLHSLLVSCLCHAMPYFIINHEAIGPCWQNL